MLQKTFEIIENSMIWEGDEDIMENCRPEEYPIVREEEAPFFDSDLDDVNFSDATGKTKSFKKGLASAKKKVKQASLSNKIHPKKKVVTKKTIGMKYGERGTKVEKLGKKKKITKVIVPADQNVIIESVDKFILSDQYDWMKNLSMYKGEKLKEVVLIYDNSNSAVDVTIDLFDPAAQFSFYIANAQDINNIVSVGGSQVKYQDICYNLLANPFMVVNAKFAITGSDTAAQLRQSLFIKNKNIEGWYKIKPISMIVQIDLDQQERDIVTFNFMQNLTRPFIPDGMDVAQYKVLAGNQVAMAFFVKQFSLKKMLFPEADRAQALLL